MKIEDTSRIVDVTRHIVEGRLERGGESYVIRDVAFPDGRIVDVPMESILDQYVGSEMRMVVVSIEDAEEFVRIAERMTE